MQTYERAAPASTPEHQLSPIAPTRRGQKRFGLVGSLNTLIDLAVLKGAVL